MATQCSNKQTNYFLSLSRSILKISQFCKIHSRGPIRWKELWLSQQALSNINQTNAMQNGLAGSQFPSTEKGASQSLQRENPKQRFTTGESQHNREGYLVSSHSAPLFTKDISTSQCKYWFTHIQHTNNKHGPTNKSPTKKKANQSGSPQNDTHKNTTDKLPSHRKSEEL